MQKPTFFARRAMLILIVVFFLVPFALRGTRMALLEMKNDVKDWLPKDLEETRDLDEFRRHFLSEQFVLVSWEGCYGDAADERFKLFIEKLTPETPPSVLSQQAAAAEAAALAELTGEAAVATSAPVEEGPTSPTQYIQREDDFIGDRLGLFAKGGWHQGWGAQNEKWLRGKRHEGEGPNEECWYYLTPSGDLFRWNSVDAPLASLTNFFYRKFVSDKVEGTLVHSFGPVDGPWYHSDPRRMRASLFKTVTTGPQVLASLTQEGGELSGSDELRAEAKRRLSGVLFGPDGKTTCLMLTLTDPARRNLHLVCGRGMLGKPRGRLYEIAAESNIQEGELRMGGPPVDNVAIDEEGSITLARLIGYSAVLGIGLSLICFRSISATIIVVFVGGISALTSVAMVWWSGSSVDAIMLSMPSMIYVLGLSGAAHIMNYYREAVDQHGHAGAPETAVARGWKPAFLCELTTALGLITLVTSELVPIRKFGLYSALGVMVMFVIMLTYLPAALQIWPQKRRITISGGPSSWLDKFLGDFWQRLGGWIINHHGVVAVGCTLLIVAFGLGITRMRTSVNLLKMFHSEAKLIKDYGWLEANLGNLVPMEVVVRVPKSEQCPSNEKLSALAEELASESTTAERKAEIEQTLQEAQFQLSFLERMELAARVQEHVEEEFGANGRDVVGRAISAATFVRPLPKAGGGGSARLTRTSTSGRLEAHREQFLHSDYLRVKAEDETELWRVSLRLGTTKGVDYGAFVSSLQETVEPVMAAQHQRQAILRQLDTYHREHGKENAAVANSRVLLVGAPASAVEKDATVKLASSAAATPVDQRKIFARTLRDLLTISRLRLDTINKDSRDLPKNIEQTLAGYDCVVVLADVPGLDIGRIESASKLVIDTRHQMFAAGGGQRTAWQRDPSSIAAVYTGVVPIVYKAQRMLLESLIQSTFWSIITITPLLMWIARSVSAGAVAMLPNVLPIVMVFGGMGWLGIDIDVGAMMTASIALGVAVDDTIHYLNWYREELDRLGDRKLAILAAYKHCATPTVQAALISGLGLSIFAFSTFTPTQRFGTLMLTILWAGAVAELIYFPALLAGPLGLVFKPRKREGGESRTDHRADTRHEQPLKPQLQVIHAEEAPDEPLLAIIEDEGAEPKHQPSGAGRPNYLRHLRQDAGQPRKS